MHHDTNQTVRLRSRTYTSRKLNSTLPALQTIPKRVSFSRCLRTACVRKELTWGLRVGGSESFAPPQACCTAVSARAFCLLYHFGSNKQSGQILSESWKECSKRKIIYCRGATQRCSPLIFVLGFAHLVPGSGSTSVRKRTRARATTPSGQAGVAARSGRGSSRLGRC